MNVSRVQSRASSASDERDQVVLFVPNAHCPSCVSAIRSTLEPFTSSESPRILDLQISYLDHIVSFRIPGLLSSRKLPLLVQIENLIRSQGFDVERTTPVPAALPTKRHVIPRLIDGDGSGSFWARVGWPGKKEKEANERRRRHMESCAECRRNEAAQVAALDGAHSELTSAPEALSVHIDKPALPKLVESKLSVEGMFCGSCTGTIERALTAHPAVLRAKVNLLANSATVSYDSLLVSTKDLVSIIDEAGYEAAVVETKQLEPASAVAVGTSSLLGGGRLGNVKESTKDDKVVSQFSVEGMTCAACSTTVTQLLSKNPSIFASDVSVLSSSATVTHLASLDPALIAESIDDAGYDCVFIGSAPLVPSSAATGASIDGSSNSRNVTLAVDGMYCNSCVAKVNSALASLQSHGQINSFTALTLSQPTTTINYRPSPPAFSIRTLLLTLTELDEVFSASVVKAPSVISRAREIQAREAKILLWHLVLAFGLAVPVFIIGIVGMVLSKKDSPFRQYWETPVWGGASRGTVTLFPLATIAQFAVGRIFYARAFRSVLPRLMRRRRGLPTPTRYKSFSWRSLVSFGSMDLLVVLSTTTAYFASLAMLAVDVSTPRTMTMGMNGGDMVEGPEKMMTLFDSSVFLIFFILAGRVLEAYAKSRTGDAVALLGSLRPDTALLLEPGSFAVTAPALVPTAASPPSPALTSISSIETKHSSSAINTKPFASGNVGDVTTLLVPVEVLELGDEILVQAGSLPPTDGTIVKGATTLDESSLTGESKPIKKTVGDEVLTGTVNLGAAIVMRVDKLGEETMIESIVRAVSEAQTQKSPIELLAERVTGGFVPIIVYFALLTLAVWLALAMSGAIPDSYIKAGVVSVGDRVFFAFEFFIAVLVVACPCGIGLAAPTAAAVGLGLAAKSGVLARGGGAAFQAATRVDTLAFDKTGTLTTGSPSVTDHDFSTANPISSHFPSSKAQTAFILAAIRQLEEQSSHPLATSLRTFASELGLTYESCPEVVAGSAEEIVGRGLKGVVSLVVPSGRTERFEVAIGNEVFMKELSASSPDGMDPALITRWKQEAKSVVLVSVKSLSVSTDVPSSSSPRQIVARFAIADPPRPEAAETIAALRASGKEVWMLSGDNIITAKAVARQVGIDEAFVVADLLPQHKADHIRKLQGLPSVSPKSGSNGHRFVLFAGDGLNDSVALAAADVGVAMGGGSQVSIVSADFVLLNSSLDSLSALLAISRRVFRRTQLNFAWALVFNVICLPLAAGVFYAAGKTKLSPVWSALAMALSSVSVVTSSLALRWGW